MFNYLRYGSYSYHLENIIDGEIVRVLLLGSLIAAIIVYFAFLSKRNDGRFSGFIGWIYDFLNFDRLMLEGIIKILYLLFTFFYVSAYIYILLHGGNNVIFNLFGLIVGVVLIRIGYEFILMVIMLCKNVSDINKKMKMDENSNQKNPYRNYNTPGVYNMNNSSVQPETSFGRQSSNIFGQPQPSNGQNASTQQSSVFVQQKNTYSSQPYSTFGQPEQTSSQHTMSNTNNLQPEKDRDNRNEEQPMNTGENVELSQETSSKKSVDSFTDPLPVIQNVKYCNVCGNVLEADDVFCANCGNRVD